MGADMSPHSDGHIILYSSQYIPLSYFLALHYNLDWLIDCRFCLITNTNISLNEHDVLLEWPSSGPLKVKKIWKKAK
jgi:hypothetical protein